MADKLFSDDISTLGFFGLGRTTLALLELDEVRERSIVLRCDGRIPREKIPPGLRVVGIHEGECAYDDICEDILLLSPSVRRTRPELSAARERGVRISSDTELFFERVKKPVFAITGSDGKSTVTALTGELLTESFPGVRACGNIGEPLLPILHSADAFAVELSSFQLSYLSPRTRRATITNITPNHLNWHSSFREYTEAKLTLAAGADELVLNLDDPMLKRRFAGKEVFAAVSAWVSYERLRNFAKAEIYYTLECGKICRNGVPLIDVLEIKRSEPHNIKNIMLASALCDGFASADKIRAVAREFPGLPHRCQFITETDGVTYVDSSIDTTPARTVSTLCALGRRVVIILGGRGKGIGFESLVPALKKYARAAIIYGECASEIEHAISGALPTVKETNFTDAVKRAAHLALAGEVVLLSPAATSYGEFSSFEERGNRFAEIVKNMKK